VLDKYIRSILVSQVLYLRRVQFTCRSDARLSILVQAATMSREQW